MSRSHPLALCWFVVHMDNARVLWQNSFWVVLNGASLCFVGDFNSMSFSCWCNAFCLGCLGWPFVALLFFLVALLRFRLFIFVISICNFNLALSDLLEL